MTQADLCTSLFASEVPLGALHARLGTSYVESDSFSTKASNVDVLRPTGTEGPTLMIKQSPQWDAAHARGMWATLELLRSYADRSGLAPFAATPRNWGSDPAYVCSDWVEGRVVSEWFSKTFADCELNVAFRRALKMSHRYASHLAHYHHAMSDAETLADVIPKKSKTVEQAGLGIRVITMLRGGKGVRRSERVRSIDDPGPHNAVEAPDDSLWLIDLPAHFESVMVERDMARLVSRQVGAVQKNTNSLWIPRLKHYRRIVDAVVDGYESVGSPQSRPADRALLYACLAADAALKTARTRRRRKTGTRLEAFVRELLAMILLGIGALWLRFRQPAVEQRSRRIKNSAH